MSDRVEPVAPETFQALCAAFYCLHDLLVAKGAFVPGEAAWHLTRLRGGSPAFEAALAGIADNLRAMPFRPQNGPELQVIEGGQKA